VGKRPVAYEDFAFLPVNDELTVEGIDDVTAHPCFFCFLGKAFHAVQIFISRKNGNMHKRVDYRILYLLVYRLFYRLGHPSIGKCPGLISFWGLVAVAGMGCAAGSKTSSQTSVDTSVDTAASEKLPAVWTQKVDGAISGLSFSKNGKAILVASSPDHDIEGSSDHYLLSRWDDQGRRLWQQKVKAPIKDQDLSEDGELAVVVNYEHEILVLDAKGNLLWQGEGTCQPHILQRIKKILCYHDDDAEPRVAYDLYDWGGRRLFSYSIEDDILALKVSEGFASEQVGSQFKQNLVFALTGGQIVLMQLQEGLARGGETPTDFQQILWKKAIEGEIVDLSVSQGSSPRVAVLYKDAQQLERVAVFDSQARPIGVFSPSFRAQQLEIDAGGDFTYYYGNSSSGQFLGSAPASSSQERWRQGTEYFTEYSYSIFLTPHRVWMGLEQPNERQSHLLGFDSDGRLRKDFQVVRGEAAYLYTQKAASEDAGTIVVGSDDGKLSLFRYK
jgi:hypothetical protein